MPLVNRFTATVQGAMVLTGNTLQIRENVNFPPAANDFRNGAYISTNTSLVAAAGFPSGTTFSASQNSAQAILSIPSGSTVLFAQLFWTKNDSSNASVTFVTPVGTNLVAPNTALNQAIGSIQWRVQDVTTIVNNAGGGIYTVGNVSGPNIINGSTSVCNAWYLIVVYKNASLPYRYFNVNTGIVQVATNAPSDFTFSNIVTPSSGVVKGYLLVSETFGDLIDGARISVGTSLATAVQVGNTSTGTWNGVTPYAQINNMLPANILIADTNDASIGLLDTRGSFGTFNKDPFAGTAPAFARTNADILGLDISNTLTNNQTSLFTRVFYAGSGSGQVTSQSIQVDVNAATLKLTKIVDKPIAKVNDTLTYTVTIANSGLANADNSIFIDTIPTGTTFVSGSVFIDNVSNSLANPQLPGINLGTIATNSIRTVTFSVKVSSTIPSPNPLVNNAQTTFSFIPGTGLSPVFTDAISNNAITTISTAILTSSKTATPIVGVGDVITYTIPISNIGNTTANNIVFIDTIPTGTTFVSGSLTQDSTPVSGSPNPPGTSLPNSLGANRVTTISFKVTVNTIPSPNPLTNTASATYDYTVDPSVPTNGSGSTNTSTASTTINYAIIQSTKTANKQYADVGDIITYSIALKNNGNTTANSIVFIDTIPNGTTLNANSLTQGITPVSGSPNPPGVTLPNSIGPGATSTVIFSVTVNTIPIPNPIPNSASGTYTYTGDPSLPSSKLGDTNSNTVNVLVNNANLSNISKSVDKAFASVGDTITYLITIPNVGSTTANNVVFTDTVPNGTTFIANSVRVNGATQSGQVVAPPTGITLPNIGANSFVTLSFQVLVTTFPVPNPIPNSGTVRSTYTVDPTLGTTATASGNTNFVNTQVNTATITSTKSVSPSNVLVGGTINYTIVLKNTGNTTAQNVVFTDTIPNGTSFVSNSLKVNGVTNPNSPAPPTGITLSDMGPNGVQTVTFSVTATTIPTPNPTPNSSTTNFNYVLDTITGATIPSSSNSNTVTAYINPNSNPLKIVDKQYATVGDTLQYTVVWRNIISVAESNVTIVDTIPSGVTFVPGSISITGGSQTGTTITPPNGLNVGTVPVGSAVTITFNVTVNTIPTVNPIPNEVTAGYDFVSDPTLGTVTHDTSLSNTVTTQVNLATISSATKTVDKDFAKVGDILEYTVVFRNTGNVTANNIVLIDTIPNGTSFVINSVKIDEVTQPGAVVAPTTGLSVGTLGSGVTTTVKFQVTVVTIPTTNPIPNTAAVGYNFQVDPVQNINKGAQINTNTVNTRVNFADITSPVKTVSKAYANVGDTLVYTVVLRNTGNVTATNIVFIDTIPTDTTLVPNTFKQDSTNITGSPNPPGITLPNSLAPGSTTTINFNVIVNTIPSPNPIPNTASEYYSYVVDPTLNTTAIGSGNTNSVLTTVNNANLGNISKSVDKLVATCGDILTYTVAIPNSGNIAAFNVVLRDTIPNGTSLVANSVTVNSVTQPAGTNPQTGINIGTISGGTIATVTFQVKVNC